MNAYILLWYLDYLAQSTHRLVEKKRGLSKDGIAPTDKVATGRRIYPFRNNYFQMSGLKEGFSGHGLQCAQGLCRPCVSSDCCDPVRVIRLLLVPKYQTKR